MNITEDYVSFETSKLLKEKGFECEKDSVTAMYNEIGKFHSLSTAADEYYYDYNDFDEYDYVAPTLQMTMKWLREVHNIFIIIEPHTYDYINEKNSSYVTSLWQGDNYYENITSKDYPTYEDAVEAALKYCLTNLIK